MLCGVLLVKTSFNAKFSHARRNGHLCGGEKETSNAAVADGTDGWGHCVLRNILETS
jgi:hypothetical protein